MNIEKWQLLLKAIDTGSLSAAASQTNYTTSGISRIIATLEEEVGFPLLVRNYRGVTPTKECEALLPDIRNLIHAEELLSQQVAQLNGLEIGSLTIGTAYSSSYPILTKRVVKFVKRYPNIKVSILWGYNSELRQAVLERKIDVCIVSKGEDDLLWFPLQEDRMIALVSSQHPLACAKVFPIRLSPQSLILTSTTTAAPILPFCSNVLTSSRMQNSPLQTGMQLTRWSVPAWV